MPLFLKRRKGQSVAILDGLIRVEVVEAAGGWATLMIDAPREVPIHRQEVQDRITAEKEAGSNGPGRG